MDYNNLIEAAKSVALNAYCVYSNFRVGAALLSKSGKIYTGCNIENRSYGATICAERSALSQAVSNGETSFTAIAIYSPDSNEELTPCGICRQVLSEFNQNMAVICLNSKGNYTILNLSELMPFDTLHNLKNY